MPLKKCPSCLVEFKANKNSIKYCSTACAAIPRKALIGSKNPNWRGGCLDKVCLICKTQFKAGDPNTKMCKDHRRRSGAQIHNYKQRVNLICHSCGLGFETTARQADNGQKCCSVSCSNRYRNSNNKKYGTGIEKIMEAYLHSLPCEWSKQVNVANIAVVDFIVGSTIIQMDGVYWHSLPGREKYDDEQDEKLNALGYTVIRISDEEMKKEDIGRLLKRKAMMADYHNIHRVSWR